MNLDISWHDLALFTGGELVRGDSSHRIRAICTDTRLLQPGQVFWALRGERYDAHHLLDERLARIADGWIVRRGFKPSRHVPDHIVEVPQTLKALGDLALHHRQRFQIPVVGIVGSNGKTTVKQMLRAILSCRGPVCANAGNFNNEIGLPLSVLELIGASRYGVFEMGESHPGDIRYLARIARPTHGVLTNVGPAHLEFLGDLEGVFQTISEILEILPPPAPVILNGDDPWLAKLLPTLGKRALSFGVNPNAQVRIQETPGRLELLIQGQRVGLERPWLGRIHRVNAAAAAAAALSLGIGVQEIEKGLLDFSPAPLRFQPKQHASGAWLVVDAYNANPASMKAGIETFLESCPVLERILVLGDMKELGRESAQMHRDMGRWLATLPIATLYLTGKEMREALAGFQAANTQIPVRHIESPQMLAQELGQRLRKGVAVYFKASRAMRLEDIAEKL